MALRRRSLWALALLATRAAAQGTVLQVGPGRPFTRIADAARAAREGDTVEVQAGEYRGDVASWRHNGLRLRAVGGRVRLIADGAAAEDKAIWVVRGEDILIEGFDFVGARVQHRNGAGIRFERGRLTVRDCRFEDNENGILTGNERGSELLIERSQFHANGAGDGYSHNLYVGRIARLEVRASAFTDARTGHQLKSRAAHNEIHGNRLIEGDDARGSYELDLPNGGVAHVTGNLIRQGPGSINGTLVSYGAEGYTWPRNALVLRDNTLVDDRPAGGVYLRVAPGQRTVLAEGNRLQGRSRSRASTLGY